MGYTKIRKNASKKIAGLIAESTYIMLETQSMGLDDCFRSNGETEVDVDYVNDFMQRNYADLYVRLYTDENGVKNHMTISDGPYHFCDEITVYFTPKPVELIEVTEIDDKPAKPRMTLAAVQAYLDKGFISPLNHGVQKSGFSTDPAKQIEVVFVQWSESETFNSELGCNNAFDINKTVTIEQYEKLAWRSLASIGPGACRKTRITISTADGNTHSLRHDISRRFPSLREYWEKLVDYRNEQTA